MKKYFVLIVFFALFWIIQGATIIVDIEGNGDYISIQEGINASADGDTVLVYPGRYYENTDFNGKSIALGSLEMTTGNRDYIHNTIIDGNQAGCCVAVHNNEGEGTALRGFTITNGIGFLDGSRRYGGGIYASESIIEITNCIVEYNKAIVGGGILIEGGQVNLTGSTFRFNYGTKYGGGIASYNLNNSIEYSEVNRCNVYENFSLLGFDVHNSTESGSCTEVIVDTFTVSEPWGYEFYQGDGDFIQDYESMIFDVQHYKYERVESDLFVSTSGNDSNSGLSIEYPLQTINHALRIISADEENPRTIHLANGIYTTIFNYQLFPISMRGNVSIVGESRDNTIIDLSIGHQGFVIDLFSEMNYELKNFTVRNAFVDENDTFYNKGFYLSNRLNYDGQIIIENIKMEDNDMMMLISASNMNIVIKDVIFNSNHYSSDIVTATGAFRYNKRGNAARHVLLENIKSTNNEEGSLYLVSPESIEPEVCQIDLVNSEFSDNYYVNNQSPDFHVGLSIDTVGEMNFNIINCTFTNNHMTGPTIGSAPIRLLFGSNTNIINSIIYNNTDHSIIIEGESGFLTTLNMHHNIVEGGLDGFITHQPYVLNWDEETNWDTDPLFLGEGDYPYSLQEGSPAINMGTTILPEGIELPEYDLAGNPRIMGNGIELGAYEYNPYGNSTDENVIEINNDLLVYPNPISISITRDAKANILWLGEGFGDELSIEIFNIKGQKLRKLKIDPLSYNYSATRDVKLKMNSASWDLCDQAGEIVSSGVYFVRVKAGNEYIAQCKLTVVK
ncbi:MAG: choice-of-anchor Q domain-containing protein [Candidatus Stygibacter australis]|nr:choice-of-anchor Q domain-containing protein [Candidatus Stygibacter australis]MDP8320826.1 choice-of-anchor Q domain-containing protein [Candidatus Stygibacter australis]